VLTAYAELIQSRKPQKAERIKKVIIPFIEKIGVGKWQRFELTDLGLRVATRNVIEANATLDTVDEATIFAADNNPE
jgi:hypothetical protein